MPKNSTDRPNKPAKDFPLFAHATGRWAKKVKGKTCYFGPWDSPQAALSEWLRQKDYLLAGVDPPPKDGEPGLTVKDLANAFLTAKTILVQRGELSTRSLADYHATCGRVVEHFGGREVESLTPADFRLFHESLSEKLGPVSLGNHVNRTRIMFRFAFTDSLIDKQVRFGGDFKKPSVKTLRRERRTKGPRTFSAADLRTIIDAATVPLKAMVLLGANCGLGNNDIACLPISAVDFDTGWLNFPRPKTEVERRCPLWPETLAAIRDVLLNRPSPKPEAESLLFVTRQGRAWVRHNVTPGPDGEFKAAWLDAVHLQFSKMLTSLGLKKPGLSFYALRHCFETQAGESKDQVTVDAIMGHVDPTMAGTYREGISDDRRRAVVAVVRAWLWPVSTVDHS